MAATPELADTEPQRRSVRSESDRGSGVRLGSIPANSEEDLRFLQDRVALFGKTTFLISSMFLVATAAADAFGEVRRYTADGRIAHTVGTLLALGVWLIARARRSLSPSTLQALDVAARSASAGRSRCSDIAPFSLTDPTPACSQSRTSASRAP